MKATNTCKRKNELKNGKLIDVTKQAKGLGFRMPVAITKAVHKKLNSIPYKYRHKPYEARLCDLLYLSYKKASANITSSGTMYQLNIPTVQYREGKMIVKEHMSFVLKIDEEDMGDLAITIRLLREI